MMMDEDLGVTTRGTQLTQDYYDEPSSHLIKLLIIFAA